MRFRWLLLVGAVIGAALIGAAGLSGEPLFLIPTLLIALVIVSLLVAERTLSESVMRRHHYDPEEALSDHQESLPSAHVITDEDTPLGDTREAHGEINPRDLPPNHPGRKAAETKAAQEGGTTRGDQELVDQAPRRKERLSDAPLKHEGLEDEDAHQRADVPSRPVADPSRRQLATAMFRRRR